MTLWVLGFLIGVVAILQLHVLPPIWYVLATFPIVYLHHSHIRSVLLGLAIGMAWTVLYLNHALVWQLPKSLEAKTVVVTGDIASLPVQDKHRVSFNLQLRSINGKPQRTLVHLNWYGKYPRLNAGDRWQLYVRLKRPHGLSNPGGFDYEEWLFQHHIRATGYVRANTNNHRLLHNRFHYPILRVRQYLNEKINNVLQGQKYSELITSLTIGSRAGISQHEWQVFRNTGTSHLMAISGLHIGMIAGFIFLLFGALWRLNLSGLLRWPAQQVGAIAALLAAFSYSALAGFSLPTQRSLIMISVFMCILLLRRNMSSARGLMIALCVVLIADPLAVLSPGFWLSFGAVAFIFYGMSGRIKPNGIWWRWGRVQWVVTFGLMPLTLLLFDQFSLIGWVANLFAIPWVGFIVLPLSLLGCVLLPISTRIAHVVLLAAAKAMGVLWFLLNGLASLPNVTWKHSIPNGWVMVATTVGILLILAPSGLPRRWLSVFWLFPLFFYHVPGPKAGEVWFSLLDVGQGLSAVVRTQHHVLVYDTGPKYGEHLDAGASVVVPFLKAQGVHQVDRLVVSHGDNDHIGGAASVINELIVKEIITSVPKRFLPRHASYCFEGQHWQWDGVEFRFLYPPKGRYNLDNNSSCVLSVRVGDKQILLTGDIEKLSERYLIEKEAGLLKSTILVAPHHGSKTSSTLEFIKRVLPQYVLFPVGYLNRFRFPDKKVVQRYFNNHVVELDTAKSGAILFRIGRDGVIEKPVEYRKNHKRIWNFS